MKLGSRVRCDGYVKKAGINFELTEDKAKCFFWDKGKRYEVEDCQTVEKFTMVNTSFYGVYVGTTELCTALVAEGGTSRYDQKEYFKFYSCKPKQFAIVYYAKNRKRLVPIDMALETEE